jgi:hypothetical protein
MAGNKWNPLRNLNREPPPGCRSAGCVLWPLAIVVFIVLWVFTTRFLHEVLGWPDR